MKIALDTNATRRLDFINYLIKNRDHFKIYIPTVVQMELGYYYISHGMNWSTMVKEIAKWNGILMEFNQNVIPEVIKASYANRGQLSFRDHFRDYFIGVEASKVAERIITYNKSHFHWLNIPVLTPEELILEINSTAKG
jgi:predicted nucleic acid-binding protein